MLTFFFTSDLLKVIRSLADQDPGILMGFFFNFKSSSTGTVFLYEM